MEDDPLRRLQNLQRDLISFTESRLANVDRLNAVLDATIEDFRKLLERSKRNKQSRDALGANAYQDDGEPKYKITLDGAEWSINNDFREGAITVADQLDLDELEAAKLYLAEQRDSADIPEILPLRTVLRFHNQREILLQCLRMLAAKAADPDAGDDNASTARAILNSIIHEAPGSNPESAYWRKCVDGLSDIEQSIKATQDHIQMMNVTGQSLTLPEGEALQVQRMVLTHQHEALVSIMVYLIKERYVKPEDYRHFLSKAAATDTSMDIMSNYAPVLLSGSDFFGNSINTQDDDAFSLHKQIAPGPGQLQWKMKQMQAASAVWWLAALSGRAAEAGLPRDRIKQLEEDRRQLWEDSCKGQAFHLMLAIVEFLSPEVWYDPAKAGLVGYLLDSSASFPPDATAPSRDFAMLVSREFQIFVDRFVNNMPDFLRRMQRQEDDERRNFVPTPLEPTQVQTMDLERFMLVIAGAYEEDPEAADDFWADSESSLQGFLVWASQRLPTPRVAAFCELLRALANDERSANHTHHFLLAEHYATDNKGKCGVTWTQIFTEIEFYAAANQRKPTIVHHATSIREDTMGDPDISEKETPIMLEAYLRLATHICQNSSEARNWILRVQPFHIHDQLLQLVSSAVESNVQACCFDMLAALTTEKTTEVNAGLWNALDMWIAGGGQAGSGIPRSQPTAGFRPPSEKQYLQQIGANPEVATAFVRLLIALIVPVPAETEPTLDSLPFPDTLGASHRQVGIEVYVDFVLDQVFVQPLKNSGLYQNRMLSNVLRHACLTFAHLCLSTFNEDLIVLANKTSLPVDSTIRAKSLADYCRLHPFARTMEHMFNNDTIAALFDSLHQSLAELETMTSLSPLTQTTLKAVQVMNLTMKLQPTYFDIVRPLIKTKAASRSETVANAAIASFDEVMLTQLDAVMNIETFAVCEHTELALESLQLLKKLSSSKRLTSVVDTFSGQRVGNRLVGRVQDGAEAFATVLNRGFEVDEIDLEAEKQPLKVVKARAILDLLSSSIDASLSMPGIAHSLLGLLQLDGRIRAINLQDGSLFTQGRSLFHVIAQGAVDLPTTFKETNVSWLLALKSGCVELVTKLATAPMTSSLIQDELRTMDFLPAMAINLLQTPSEGPWDQLSAISPETLMGSAGGAIRDFMRIREAYFEYAALEIKSLSTTYRKSILEKDVAALLGTFIEDDLVLPTASLLTLLDFFDIVIAEPLEASRRYFADFDMSSCVVESPQALLQVDLKLAEQYLLLRRLELWQNGVIKDANEEVQLSDEIAAILAGLGTSNLYTDIARARSDAIEVWTDALSTVVTAGGLAELEQTHLAVQALQVVLPRFEKSLSDNVDAAGLFARLTLTLVHAASKATALTDRQVAINREDRLSAAFRICIKSITDSETGPALRDVCYRTCCSVLSFAPMTPTGSNSPSTLGSRQLAQQVQASGERILRVITEDAFSGRGSTRVSALLCLDAFLSLFRTARSTTSILRALTKLNFVPVLIDNSIGSIEAAFRGDVKDLPTTLAYFHTALALLLNLCSTPDGTQLILNSGFFSSVSDSQLFSTDPDIGLDVDNPAALREFCRILASILRVITAAVAAKGPGNAATLQQAKAFLTQNRFSVQAVFKRTSRVDRTSAKPEAEALEVADEFAKLMLLTDFLEDDEPVYARSVRSGGFT